MLQKLKINDKKTFILILVLSCLSTFDHMIDGARYIKYTALPIALLVLSIRKFKLPKEITEPETPFLLLTAWAATTVIWGNHLLGSKDVFFIASYIIPLILFQKKGISIEHSFIIYIIIFLTSTTSRELGSFSISDSTTLIEGSESFVFGAFALAFAMRKKHALTAVALLLLMLTLKRIALLGFLACIFLWMAPHSLKEILTNKKSILAFNITILASLLILATGSLDEIIFSITGKSASALTLGRTAFYAGVIQDMIQNPYNLIFGNGAGSAYEKALTMYQGTALNPNLHSDTLKILYEYGILFFLFFFYSIGACKEIASRIIMIYVCILLATDNVMIYSDVMFLIIYISYRLSNPHTKPYSPKTPRNEITPFNKYSSALSISRFRANQKP